jgi:hypothetical protein
MSVFRIIESEYDWTTKRILQKFDMKKFIYSMIFLLFVSMTVTTSSSCNRGYGCPDNLGVKTDRRGNLSTKRGQSSIMPKSMTKKKRRRN